MTDLKLIGVNEMDKPNYMAFRKVRRGKYVVWHSVHNGTKYLTTEKGTAELVGTKWLARDTAKHIKGRFGTRDDAGRMLCGEEPRPSIVF